VKLFNKRFSFLWHGVEVTLNISIHGLDLWDGNPNV
jgi:hypothetical protein